MRFAILGPLQVYDGTTPLRLGGGHQRRLLALLLLQANWPVSSESLIDELWGGRPPETAAKALQGLVSQLRKQLGGGRGRDGFERLPPPRRRGRPRRPALRAARPGA